MSELWPRQYAQMVIDAPTLGERDAALDRVPQHFRAWVDDYVIHDLVQKILATPKTQERRLLLERAPTRLQARIKDEVIIWWELKREGRAHADSTE